MFVTTNEELQLIRSLYDTDVDKDDQASPSIRQSTNSFTVNEVISVLERISSSMHDKARSCLCESNPIEHARKETIIPLWIVLYPHLLRHFVNAKITCKTLKVIIYEPSSWKESFPR